MDMFINKQNGNKEDKKIWSAEFTHMHKFTEHVNIFQHFLPPDTHIRKHTDQIESRICAYTQDSLLA